MISNHSSRWEPRIYAGGRSALAFRERISTLITRFPGFPVQLGGSWRAPRGFPLTKAAYAGRVLRSVHKIRV